MRNGGGDRREVIGHLASSPAAAGTGVDVISDRSGARRRQQGVGRRCLTAKQVRVRRSHGRLLLRLLGSVGAGGVGDGGEGDGDGEHSTAPVAGVGEAGREVEGIHGLLGCAVHLNWEPFALVDRKPMTATATAERTTEDQSTVTAR